MRKPRLLDLFCKAGGAATGYHRAGFDIVGVDIDPQPRFPFVFVQADALEYLGTYGREYDVIHASPPCQGYSRLRHLPWLKGKSWPLLIEPCERLLRSTGKPYVIENVEDAPIDGIVLCGRMFGLPVYRHRRFGSNTLLMAPPHEPHTEVIGEGRRLNDRKRGTLNAGSQSRIVTVAGNQCSKADAERALGIDWMTKVELSQAIPPAYTAFAGSGTTGIACAVEGARFIGIDESEEYAAIARKRIAHWGAQQILPMELGA